jgi:hypothetical protein
MAVTGKFDADFEDFKREVDESTDKLKGMETQADAVGQAVDKALQPQAGGGGGLDTLGGSLGNVGTAAAGATTELGNFAAANEAAVAGGVEMVSVTEMEAAGFLTLQGQTAQTIAEIASGVGAVELLGSAFIGWKLGRVISDLFDLDRTIGNATAKLLGMGDAAGQAAAATADTLTRASEAAGYAITNLHDAIQVLTDKDLERLKTTLRGVADQQADRMFSTWHKQIEELTASGLIPQLTKDLDAHAFSMKELAKWYQVDVGAIQEYARELAKQRAAEKDGDQQHLAYMQEVDRILKAQDDAAAKRESVKAKVRELERNHLIDQGTGLLGLSKIEQETSQKDFEATVKRITAHQKLVDTIQAEVTLATAENTAMTLGAGTPDPARDAALKRDATLAQVAAQQKKAPEMDLSALIVNAWLKYDQEVGARGATKATAAPAVVNMNVSGVFDPSSIRQLTDAISQELMRRTGADRYLPAR